MNSNVFFIFLLLTLYPCIIFSGYCVLCICILAIARHDPPIKKNGLSFAVLALTAPNSWFRIYLSISSILFSNLVIARGPSKVELHSAITLLQIFANSTELPPRSQIIPSAFGKPNKIP